ncbi:MAG: acetylxylan esterase [Acidobacteriota bacterium]
MTLTRREWLSRTLGGFAVTRLRSATEWSYPGVQYREYPRCLPDYLSRQAEQAYQRRNRQLARLSTPDRIRQRQEWVRETFWDLVGGRLERTPLQPRLVSGFTRPAYRVENIIYESRPGFFISANLYIPTQSKPPFPGVLFQMGHSLNGKAAEPYQKCCQGLAQLGFLVLAFDPMGQGERTYYPHPAGTRTRLPSADDEHTLPGKQMLLIGDTASQLQVWDAIRSLDYLGSHPLVDAGRLASTGQSGGGTLTMLLAAADDRLAAAVVACGNTENFACAGFNPPGSTDDAEQNFLNSGPVGFDRWDLLYPLAPKPLLVLASAKDFFGTYSPRYLASGWEEFQKLRKVYEALDASDHLNWIDTPLPHGLSYYLRLQIYNWFLRWLRPGERVISREPPVAAEPERSLWVSSEGNLIRAYNSETPFTLNRARARRVVTPSLPGDIVGLLHMDPSPDKPHWRVLGRVASESGVSIESVEVQTAASVWVPAWLFLPVTDESARPVTLLLEPAGRNLRWGEGALFAELAGEGYLVCAADVRGIGDLSPEFPRGAPRHARWHQDEEAYAWASLILGKPLLGQRVTDLLAVVRALKNHPAAGRRPIVVAARGTMTVPALFLAALEPSVERLYLGSGLLSFRNLIDTENYEYPLANFIRGLLSQTDLPELATSLAPRPVCLAGVLNAAGQKLDADQVKDLFSNAGHIQVLPEDDWSLQGLAPFFTGDNRS